MIVDLGCGGAPACQVPDGEDLLGAEGAADAGGREAGSLAEGFQSVRSRCDVDPAVGQEQSNLLIGGLLDRDEVLKGGEERIAVWAVVCDIPWVALSLPESSTSWPGGSSSFRHRFAG
ncbi:hypothetical protein ACWDFR_44295 [Streptomyces sp. 900105755]